DLMLAGRWANHPFVLGVLLTLLSAGGRQLWAQTTRQAPAGTPAVGELFRQHCVKCHGADGTGTPARGSTPRIPDFTTSSWQARRSEGQLLASILDGKGKEMPAFRGKLSADQARDLAAHVRSFAPVVGRPGPEQEKGLAPRGGFEEEFRRLQEELDELQK